MDTVAEESETDPWDKAASRVSFQLTYTRADAPRAFEPGVLAGPWIADAYRPGERSPGDWESPDGALLADQDELTEAEWVDHYAGYAIAEAIHEALEWFRVDGRPWMNPHGRAEDRIHELVGALCERFAEMRRQLAEDGSE